MSTAPQGPISFEETQLHDVSRAADPDHESAPTLTPKARRKSWITSWGLWLLGTGFSVWLLLSLERFVRYWFERAPLIGYAVMGLIAILLFIAVLGILREIGALRRLSRTAQAKVRLETLSSAKDARKALAPVLRPYRSSGGYADYQRLSQEAMDADDVTRLVEEHLLKDKDQEAAALIQSSARQVATITTLVPIALTDMVAVTWINLRMIRGLSEIYGGTGAFFSNMRLMRNIFGHLVAAGALDLSDDLLSTVIGHGALSKISRRFGEGAVNAALTTRIGLAAQAQCRPVPFVGQSQASLRQSLTRALSGILSQTRKEPPL